MIKVFITAAMPLVLLLMPAVSVQAEQKPLSAGEFRSLYDSLLAGKTLVTEVKEDGAVVRKERKLGKAIDAGGGDFIVPVEVVVTNTKDGQLEQKVTVNISSHVSDLEGQAIVSEEVRKTTVEKPGSEPQTSGEVSFGGLFRAASNEKGGFDVQSFGLMPSVASNGNSMTPAGSMVSYSCFPEEGRAKCVLTIRQYKLGDYKPLVGYTLGEPVGQDVVEVAEEVRP